MKKNLRCFIFILLYMILIPFAFSSSNQTIEKQLKAEPGQKLILDLDTGGSVEIHGWDKNLVVMKARLAGRDWMDCDVDMIENKHDVQIISRYNGANQSHSTSFRFEISVPQKFDVELQSAGGDVSIVRLNGSFEGQTGGGTINIRNAIGKIQLATGGGEVKINDSKLDGSVSTGGGDVLFERVNGNIMGSSGSGRVIRSGEESSDGSTSSEKLLTDGLRIEKAGGNVEVQNAPDGVRIVTGGGKIHIASAGQFVVAETGGGDVRIDSVEGWVQATTGAGDIRVHVTSNKNGEKSDIDLSSGKGDITITVPDSFSMDLDLQIGFTQESRSYDIFSDFPLKKEVTTEWSSREGTPRRYILGTGTVGDGKNKIHVRTVNGAIYLKKG